MKELSETIIEYMEKNNIAKPYLLSHAFIKVSSYAPQIDKMIKGKLPYDTVRARKFLLFIGIQESELEYYINHNNWRKKDSKSYENAKFETCLACGRQTLDKGLCMATTEPRCNYGFDKTKGLLEGNIARGFDVPAASMGFRRGRS